MDLSELTTEAAVAKIGARLENLGLTMESVIMTADPQPIAISTWWRWRRDKVGVSPIAYRRVMGALDAIEKVRGAG